MPFAKRDSGRYLREKATLSSCREPDRTPQWADMPIQEIGGNVAGDDWFVLGEQVQIAWAHFRGEFEADVQKLAHVGIVRRTGRIVADG